MGRLFNSPAEQLHGTILIGADRTDIGLATRTRLLGHGSGGLRHCPGRSIHQMSLDVAMPE